MEWRANSVDPLVCPPFFKWEGREREGDTATRNCLFQFCHHFEGKEEPWSGEAVAGWTLHSVGVAGSNEGRVTDTKTRIRENLDGSFLHQILSGKAERAHPRE